MIRKLLAEGSYCRGVKAGRQWPCSGNGEEHRDTWLDNEAGKAGDTKL